MINPYGGESEQYYSVREILERLLTPLPEEKLKRFENMTLGKFAAGRKNDFHILNLANNGQSSSLLEFGTHKMSYPDIDYISKIQVETKPLDDWLDENFNNKNQYNFINNFCINHI